MERNPSLPTQWAFFASSFRIITEVEDLQIGLLEILFKPKGPFPVLCVSLDLSALAQNKENYVKYVADLKGEADDSVINEKIPYSTHGCYSNMLQCSVSLGRTETIFGLAAIHDIASMKRKAEQGKSYSVQFQSPAMIYGTLGFQKKLISEILRLIV